MTTQPKEQQHHNHQQQQQDTEIEKVSATVASARLRRGRGYSYEYGLVNRFNKTMNWKARRLGGSSTGLPDIVATNNYDGILLTIECKSGAGDFLYVPPDQLDRCWMVCDFLGFYKEKHVIMAFKFMSKKRFTRKGERVYEKRKLLEYYYRIDVRKLVIMVNGVRTLPTLRCSYLGSLHAIYPAPDERTATAILLQPLDDKANTAKRVIMPWEKNQSLNLPDYFTAELR